MDDANSTLAMSDQISSPFGLDAGQPSVVLADVRAQPPSKDVGYKVDELQGELPDMTAVTHTLLLHKELITQNRILASLEGQQTGDRELGTENLQQQTGTGNWRLGQGTGGSKLETGNLGQGTQGTEDRELEAGNWSRGWRPCRYGAPLHPHVCLGSLSLAFVGL